MKTPKEIIDILHSIKDVRLNKDNELEINFGAPSNIFPDGWEDARGYNYGSFTDKLLDCIFEALVEENEEPLKYDERKAVDDFYASHPKAKAILDAFNEADPLGVYYGDDVNPGEYLSYVKKFFTVGSPTFSERWKDSCIEENFFDMWNRNSIECTDPHQSLLLLKQKLFNIWNVK